MARDWIIRWHECVTRSVGISVFADEACQYIITYCGDEVT